MKTTRYPLVAGLGAGLLACTSVAQGHAIIVDLAPGVPGFQTAISVLPGAPVIADIHLVDDGVTPISAFGLATNFNDTPGTLALLPPTIAGPGVAAIAAPIDFFAAAPTAPGLPLAPGPFGPFGIGPFGPFTGTDGGVSVFDGAGAPWPGMPGVGGTLLLETVTFMAVGPVGSITDIAPLGIFVPGAPAAGPVPPVMAPPPIGGAPGVEFYDALGVGAYGSVGFAPGANPLFPGGIGALTPGTVTIIPEPSALLLTAAGVGLTLLRRRRA